MTGQAGFSLIREAGRPFVVALVALAAVGELLVLGQAVSRAAVAPGPSGLAALAVALLPGVLALVLPVALLFGLASAARAWREGGDWLALATAGAPARSVLPAVLALGLVAGGVEAGLTLSLEPAGRRQARLALAQAAGDLRLQPGRPGLFGDTLLRAAVVDGPRLGEVFLASGATAAAAREGVLGGGGVVSLVDGEAVGMQAGAAPAWRVRFDRAELALELAAPRVELAERSGAELRALIARQRATGEDAAVARLALAKRVALPLGLPLLAVLAVPLGARGARPGLAATATVLCWWAALRLSDQAVHAWGPLPSAAAPLVAVAVAAILAWRGWRAR